MMGWWALYLVLIAETLDWERQKLREIKDPRDMYADAIKEMALALDRLQDRTRA